MRIDIHDYKSLEVAREKIRVDINCKAGRTRQSDITIITGQTEVYAAKYEDAKRYVSDGYPANTTAYPWIEAEAEETGRTANIVADRILLARDRVQNKLMTTERIRIRANALLDTAQDLREMVAIKRQALSMLNRLE